jgi:AcrR family transcriptional regulator
MPPNPERRTQILDVAIDILADIGIGGVTHRQVDTRAGLPAGTTSNYFRTRLALLEAVTARVADLHWQRVAVLQSLVGQPQSRDGVKALMARMITDPDEQARRRNIARFELFLEGTRRPELRPALNDIQAAAVKSASLILEAAGFDPSTEQMGELSRLLHGLAFSTMTFSPEQPGAEDPAGLVDRLLRSVLPRKREVPPGSPEISSAP